jgi:hypothetical protein
MCTCHRLHLKYHDLQISVISKLLQDIDNVVSTVVKIKIFVTECPNFKQEELRVGEY